MGTIIGDCIGTTMYGDPFPLEECRLDVEAAALLAKALPALTSLQILSLAHNQLEVGGAEVGVSED